MMMAEEETICLAKEERMAEEAKFAAENEAHHPT
jgi:hypothetical protein